MARVSLQPTNKVATQKNTEGNLGTFYKVNLGKVKVDNGQMLGDYDSNETTLFLNPESWQDTKSTNWAIHQVPGQSDPILQYVSGAPRTVSFEALVTNDTSYYSTFKKEKVDLKSAALNAVGAIASNFFGVNVPPLTTLFSSSTDTHANNLDISVNLNYYRSFLYPTYKGNLLSSSPPLALLAVGTTLSLHTPDDGEPITEEHDIWVLTDLDIKVTKQLPNLTPMEAVVSFKFVEYRIAPKSENFVLGKTQADSTASAPTSNLAGTWIGNPGKGLVS